MRAVLALALVSQGCVTGAAVYKKHDVSLPVLIGATVADLVVTALVTSQIDGFTTGAVVATSLAVTALDFGVGCVLGGCSSLRP